MFDENKDNEDYGIYESELIKNPDGSQECLTFYQRDSMIKINIFRYNDTQSAYDNDAGKLINKHNSLIFHSLWLDENLTQNGVSEDIIKIMRVVREWKYVIFPLKITNREKQKMEVSSEILD